MRSSRTMVAVGVLFGRELSRGHGEKGGYNVSRRAAGAIDDDAEMVVVGPRLAALMRLTCCGTARGSLVLTSFVTLVSVVLGMALSKHSW